MSDRPFNENNLVKRIRGVTMPIKRKRIKWGRNWPCLCGAKKKYKNCCLKDIDALTVYDDNSDVEKLPEDLQNMIDGYKQKAI